ncbi:MAG: SAM-dependent methyltransferase [Pyrinomonadaceae bacterium]
MIQSATAFSPIAARLRERTKREGPITFRDWMEVALYDEHEGYYCRHDLQRWGREGDYRTSPERSSLFAATFARYFAGLYEELKRPAEWTIVEVGGGDGDFAFGVLETLQTRFPEVFSATRYVIDEACAESISRIRKRLGPFRARVEFESLNCISPLATGIIFSNELLDAFPVHRVTIREGRLCEFYVAVNESEDFIWSPGPPSTPELGEYLGACAIQLKEGQVAEVNLAIEKWLGLAAKKLSRGYLITVDYGAEAADLFGSPEHFEGTLRAYQRHQLVEDVLARPGEQDITTSVDWTHVKRIGEQLGLATIDFERQDSFLLKAGLLEELEAQLQRVASDAERLPLSTNAREMILPNGMAASFQVLVQQKQ